MTAWLTYRGEYFSVDENHPQAVSVFFSEQLREAQNSNRGLRRLAVEHDIDLRRMEAFSSVPSRLRCVYAFESREDALRAAGEWRRPGFTADNLTELEIVEGSRAYRVDSEWITCELSSGSGPWIDQYLAGESRGSEPLSELLIEGRALVMNTQLRESAGEVIRREWPEAVAPLEIGRIAFMLGFPLGRMTAAIRSDQEGVPRVVYDLAFDANDPVFIDAISQALKDPTFAVDGNALKPIDEQNWFKVPDMRGQMFQLA